MIRPNHWLQVRGDPSIRSLLFQQQRSESLFDQRIETLHGIVEHVLCERDVFHIKIHYSSKHLVCWSYSDPCSYQVFVGEEVFEPAFAAGFGPGASTQTPAVPPHAIGDILSAFTRLRFQDTTIYLRDASINRASGVIGITFSCGGTHYIDYDAFADTVELMKSTGWVAAGVELQRSGNAA
ncbi:MAG: hypothetical protein JSW10_00340 [Pseudomonadota bacterium]|nr:MAG: hypothetical protein JSW10_00340 [Pseudomonadota bacterium]